MTGVSDVSSGPKMPVKMRVRWMEGACVDTDTIAVPAASAEAPSNSALYSSVERVRYLRKQQ